jgi:hypothetical protein
MKFSDHFERARADQPDRQCITLEMCEAACGGSPGSYVHSEAGKYGRKVYWGRIGEDKVRYLKVVVEPDEETIVTAVFDANYRRKVKRGERPG